MKSKYLLHTYVVHSIINICGSVESIAAWLTAKVSLNKEESNFQDERNLITIVEHFFTLSRLPQHTSNCIIEIIEKYRAKLFRCPY